MSVNLENNYSTRTRDWYVNIVLYLLPLLFLDQYGSMFTISAIAFTNSLSAYRDAEVPYSIPQKGKKSQAMIAGALFCIVFVFSALSYYGKLDDGLRINGVVLLPTYSILIYYIVPILWFLINDRDTLTAFFRIDVKLVKYIGMVCLPILIINLIMAWYFMEYDKPKSYFVQNVFQFVFTAALAEELFFRGFVYNVLKKFWNMKAAMLVSAVIFSCWHLRLVVPLFESINLSYAANLFAIFMLGLVNVIMYEKSKSLIPAIVFHALINGAFKDALCLLKVMIMG